MDIVGAIFIVIVAVLIIVSITLGILLGRINTERTQAGGAQAGTTRATGTQSGRLERAVREGTSVGIIAIGVSALVAAKAIPDIHILFRVLLFIVGGLAIPYSIIRFYILRR